MTFRARLIIGYFFLVTVLALGLGLFLGSRNTRQMERTAQQDLQMLAQNISNQMDRVVQPMEFISEFLLSEPNTLSSVLTIANTEHGPSSAMLINEMKANIRHSLVTYCIDENFHRVNFFGSRGDFITSNVRLGSIADGLAHTAGGGMTARADAARGRAVLIPPHSDDWSPSSPEEVFSLIRRIRGTENAYYIEVQMKAGTLEDLYAPASESGIRIAIAEPDGSAFYTQLEAAEQAAFSGRLAELGTGGFPADSRWNGELVAVRRSEQTGLYTAAFQDVGAFAASAADLNRSTYLIVLVIWLVSIVFVYAFSVRLTQPINRLRVLMESTDLGNLDRALPVERTSDEIRALQNAYGHLLQRLGQSAAREKQMAALQVQAEFDALQAQVNPHFLYNVLNVISHRGVVNADIAICEICERLAAMLRYSTGTSTRMVSVSQELTYVRHYLYLLKTRYQDRLVYTIDADAAILDCAFPKIILQQIVENSINHGMREIAGEMRVAITGLRRGDSCEILVTDNGCGFSPEALGTLEERIREIRRKVDEGTLRLEMDIGGMGMPNIYARMRMLYGDGFHFETGNHQDGSAGAYTRIRFRYRQGDYL